MESIDELRELRLVCQRLAERFPDLPLTTVQLHVEREHRKLDGRPVRNFVPVLIERAAREALMVVT
ncbi:three-helix bundle dimerization domain-containing protein [Pengzhenrongella sp.]|uniref:three-helix bundle dimerization domain-containing protein n=1 Tax=Pengzhenrongella sp. TaxID=2888820 RepID=UPI002F949ECD